MRGIRAAAGLLLLPFATAAAAETYADFGKPEQCGAYAQAGYDRESWFPGGEGGAVALTRRQAVKGLNAVLFDGVIVEEGAQEPAGRVLAARGPLLGAGAVLADEVLVIVTPQGVRLLQRCP